MPDIPPENHVQKLSHQSGYKLNPANSKILILHLELLISLNQALLNQPLDTSQDSRTT